MSTLGRPEIGCRKIVCFNEEREFRDSKRPAVVLLKNRVSVL